MNHLRGNYSTDNGVSGGLLQRTSLGQQAFHRLISLERRRAERSRKSFLLMLVDTDQHPLPRVGSEIVLAALMPMTRETDIIGWYEEASIPGVLFTEIAEQDLASTTTAIVNRVTKALKNQLTAQQFSRVSLSFHLLPENLDHKPSSLDLSLTPPASRLPALLSRPDPVLKS